MSAYRVTRKEHPDPEQAKSAHLFNINSCSVGSQDFSSRAIQVRERILRRVWRVQRLAGRRQPQCLKNAITVVTWNESWQTVRPVVYMKRA